MSSKWAQNALWRWTWISGIPPLLRKDSAAAVRRFGKIDIVINNAGVSGVTPIDAADSGLWMDIVNTNLVGTYQVTSRAVPHMPDGGRIVMISSVLGKFGVPGYTAYCASKTALIGFVRALALELAPRGIAVNAVCPGWVDTEMAWEGMRDIAASIGTTVEEFKKQAMARVPLGRWSSLTRLPISWRFLRPMRERMLRLRRSVSAAGPRRRKSERGFDWLDG